jgi:hypothetical protein
LCLCGCKQVTSGLNNYHIQHNPKVKYIHGHNIPEIHKLAFAKQRGSQISEEHWAKILAGLMGNNKNNVGKNNGMFGKYQTEETKLKISTALRHIWKQRKQRKKL